MAEILDTTRLRTAVVGLVMALTAALLVTTPQQGAGASAAERAVSVIVQAVTASDARVAVESVGGEVTRDLPIVEGVAAEVPASALDELSRSAGVRYVSPNAAIGFHRKPVKPTPSPTPEPTTEPTPEPTPDDFTLSPQRTAKIVRSDALWAQGITGKGVTVALIDTGVYAAHPDLAGRVVHCEDFSHEANTEAHCADTFGHGTFMAGLIAGNGASSGGAHTGTAPEANIVSVKLAGFDGATDVSNVLAGIQWTVAHKSAYGIRVMNLSLGTDSSQSHLLSPLNYAVQKAWKAGIVVVVSAGNSGPNSKTILKPADDPWVITVGASNDEGTIAITDDRVPVFSGRGPTRSNGIAKPDVVAPGVHTIGLRSPGSAVDQLYGATAAVGESYFRGTGTSMSAALASGVAAQILQANPALNPDQVKYRFTSTAKKIVDTSAYAAGKGIVDAYAATKSTSTAKANGGLLDGLLGSALSSGLGSLQSDRGTLSLQVFTPEGQGPLTGSFQDQYDAANISLSNVLGLVPFVNLTYTVTGWDSVTWALTSFVKAPWTGLAWPGNPFEATAKWRDSEWVAKWRGSAWSNTDWEAKWRSANWDSTTWRATSWQSKWYAAAWE
jgi:serine protease AprX